MHPPTQDLSERICAHAALPAASRQPLRIEGGASKLFFGTPNRVAAPLSTLGLQGVVAYEPSELVVTARAGMPLAELEDLLHTQGQSLAFEPPHFGWAAGPVHGEAVQLGALDGPSKRAISRATVGGAVASGLSGPARASVGAVRDYVLGVQMLNGRGELLQFGGTVMKNVAGYDLSRLMTGSCGTLGVITEVSLKVLPIARAQATLAFEMSQTEALRRLNAWGGQALPLNASCWTALEGSNPQQTGRLHLRLSGAQAAVAAACAAMGGEQVSAEAALDYWQALRNHTATFFERPSDPSLALWRLSVPQTAPALALPYAQLVEWHGGLRWLWAPVSSAAAIRSAALQVNGNTTVFVANKGRGYWTNGCFEHQNEVLSRISANLRAEFDPHGVFDGARMAAMPSVVPATA